MPDNMDFDAQAFGDRIQAEAKARGVSLNQLQKEVAERTSNARGTSYGNIWSYWSGKAGVLPRTEVAAAIGDVLGVLPDWLLYGVGARTEEQRRLQALEQEPDWIEPDAVLGAVLAAFGDGGDRLREYPTSAVILACCGRLLLRGVAPLAHKDELAADLSGLGSALYRMMTLPSPADVDEGTVLLHHIGTYVGRVLATPFRGLPIKASDLSDDEFFDFVSAQCQAIARITDAAQRRRAVFGSVPEPSGDE